MKLYVNSQGEWVGTQAEAKQINAELVEVPTSKPELLAYLNKHRVEATEGAAPTATTEAEPVTTDQWLAGITWNEATAGWLIRDAAQNAKLKDLTYAMAVVMNRMDEVA